MPVREYFEKGDNESQLHFFKVPKIIKAKKERLKNKQEVNQTEKLRFFPWKLKEI